jgi:hypothetical protein
MTDYPLVEQCKHRGKSNCSGCWIDNCARSQITKSRRLSAAGKSITDLVTQNPDIVLPVIKNKGRRIECE